MSGVTVDVTHSCLLVSWKVRECRPISAVKIVKYTNYSVQLETLLVSSANQRLV